jgi:hypothetical protein
MTERDRWGLRGPVQVCRHQRTWYARRCGENECLTEESGDTSTFEFHPNGSLALHRHLNPDGSEWNTIYEYDDTSRLRVRRSGDAAGNTNLRLYEYDDSGRLSRIIERTEGGNDRVVESYDYSSYGRKTKTQCVDLTSQRRNTHYSFGVEGTDTCYSAPGAATLTTLYNEREQPIEVVFCDVTGRRLSRVEFLYDTAGNLVDESQTTAVEALPAEMTASLNQAQLETVRALCGAAMMHRYDEQGHRVETRSRLGSIGGDIKTMTYNEHGDQIGEVNEREERNYTLDEEGRISDSPTREIATRSEARFQYDYDARGNWVMKTVESRSGTGNDFTVSTVERRTIGYSE